MKISVEMIIEYVYSGKLPTVTREDGVVMSFIFHPEAATEFALLWAACWLSHNPGAEITNADGWAEAVAGGNQHLDKHRQAPPTKEELETQKRESEIRRI